MKHYLLKIINPNYRRAMKKIKKRRLEKCDLRHSTIMGRHPGSYYANCYNCQYIGTFNDAIDKVLKSFKKEI